MWLWALTWVAGAAAAHDFATHTLQPGADWCAELHRLAQPADVIELLPGRYPGGCDLTLGGLAELNEALLVRAVGDEPVVIEGDPSGLSLRVSGEPTRLLGLTLDGRLEVAADAVTVDQSSVEDLVVDPGVAGVTLLFSALDRAELDLEQVVVRGNELGELVVSADRGLVADNTIHGSAEVSVPFERNLVLGDLTASSDVFANLVVGTTDVHGRLYGNTLLGPVSGSIDARNNLTTEAELSASSGNLRCAGCLADVQQLDVRPRGQALQVPLAEAPDDDLDFCGAPRVTVGAVGEGTLTVWTAFDRDAEGCVEGQVPEPPAAEPPALEVTEVGCATAPVQPASLLGAWFLLGVVCRRNGGVSCDC